MSHHDCPKLWGGPSMRVRLVTLMLASSAMFLTGVSGAAAASAGAASPAITALPGVVSQTPVDDTPNVYAGSACTKGCGSSTVYSTVIVGSEVVVSGSFGGICSPVRTQYAPCPAT